MKQQHHPTDLKSFEKGINSDANKELLGTKQGEHVDAKNMRSQTNDGNNYAKKKVKGEELLYPNVDNRCLNGTGLPLDEDYECMMTQEINGQIVEIWATDPNTNPQPSIIRVDGKIVCMSEDEDFPVRADYPLQYDKNEACIGGEFFITDNRVRPMVFNVKDLLLNSGVDVDGEQGECKDKYFDGFNPELYYVSITSELFQVAFIKQVNNPSFPGIVIGSAGLAVGQYSYSYRYATEEGDRSGWSPISVIVPVIAGKDTINDGIYAKAGNYGASPNVSLPTIYGNHIRIKYDNQSQFEFIEIRRDGWYSGGTLASPPISEIIGSFNINQGLNVIDILDYTSPAETEEALTEEDLLDITAGIERAKSVRYFNNKLWLMNIGYREKEIGEDVELLDEDEPIFPVIQKIFKKGHVDPYNTAYYKSNMRGEAYGYGLAFKDDQGNTTFVEPIIESYQYPNRRDPITPETQGMSYFGTVVAANINGQVGTTHEVFDHANAKTRDVVEGEDAQNRLSPSPTSGGSVGVNVVLSQALGQFGIISPEPKKPTLVNHLSEGRTANPLNPIVGTSVEVGTYPYQTLNPTSQTENVSDYNRRINTHVYEENGYSSDPIEYNPRAFGIDYYSMGAAFKGLNVDSLPEWVDGFSVVPTEPARRVVAQGLGFYRLIQSVGGFGANGQKEINELVCNFPDLDGGYGLYPADVNYLIGQHGVNSPYRLELVSPLGFFSEFYSYYADNFSWEPLISLTNAGKRSAIDGIAHCRILYDRGDINPTWQGSPSLNDYVGFGTWRETSENPGRFPGNNASGGASSFVIDQIDLEFLAAGQPNSESLLIRTVGNIYTTGQTGSQGDNGDFNVPSVKRWQEPVYAVNIIKENASVNSGVVNIYNYAGQYQKIRSKVLFSDGSNGQTAVLVSERWEDCIIDIGNPLQGAMVSNAYSNYERFVTVEDSNGARPWVNVTQKTPAQIAAIQNDIATNGFAVVTDPTGSYNVYGVYTDTQVIEGTGVTHRLHFDGLEPEAIVYVDYDSRIPIRFFSGDTYVNDHIFAVLDNEYNGDGEPINEFQFNLPFPYPMYCLNAYIGLVGDADNYSGPRYLTNTAMKDTIGPGVNPPNDGIWWRGYNVMPGHIYFDTLWVGGGGEGLFPSRWRQLVATWVAESRVSLAYAFNVETDGNEADSQMFPLKNYIYRPTKWNTNINVSDITTFFDENHYYEDYEDDYGFEHGTNWGRGGFRYRPITNNDYSKKQKTELLSSAPTVGFDDESDYCTRIIWSATRPINIQDSPSVKTFPPANYYDISDNTGEIKFAWDADSGKGNNLYAITDSGICLLLVDKRILSEINADELATIGADSFGGITDDLWINKDIGMDSEMWRTWAEYANALFWTNSTSSYQFEGNVIKDIAKTEDLVRPGYSELLRRVFIPKTNKGVTNKLAGVYDVLHREYWATADRRVEDEFSTLIFGVTQDALQCQSDYQYDKYLAIDNKVYGMKGLETYELGVGNLLNGEEFECYVSGVSDADSYSDKEFIRIRVNSDSKPKRIEFFDDYEQYISGVPSSTVDATANPINIKDYYGYECYIPRKAVAPFLRQQGRKVIFRIVSDDDENFFISTVGVQYKSLK
jgi:hypothetical protein